MSLQDTYKVISRSSVFDPRRTRYTTYVSWLLLPVIFLFPLVNDYTGLLAQVLLGIIGVIVISNLIVYRTDWRLGQKVIPYIGISVSLGTFLYFVYLGYGQGASAMWIFAFPLVAMFMMGAFWGLAGSISALAASVYIMSSAADPDVYHYSYEFTLRFAVSFSLVTALAFGFEYWRVSLELQKEAIDEELSNARSVIAELARVCSWCNSIKTEDDSWVSLETYVSSKEDTDVSHSICPDCAIKERAQLKPYG
jgi:hypothetical protein